MKPLKLAAWALCAFAASELPAQAAWNNVFQPTLFGRLNRTTTSSYYCQSCAPPVVAQYVPIAAPPCNTCQSAPVIAAAPPCTTCQAPPVQQCTTNYVHRSYYQPVTTYESRSYYEPVTTYQTSYYYEAVTSYQTSYYPDPCNCGYIAKSSPVTSYALKQQNCPVQSWVQRCAQVPVQSYKLSYYLEPQTTCSAPACAPVAAPPCTQPGCAPAAPTPSNSYSPQPPIIEQPRPAPSGPNVGATTNYQGNVYPNSMTTNQPKTANTWQPAVNLGPISPEAGDLVQGQVVRNDRSPTANAQVLFVNAATGSRHSITTNDAGRFNLALGAGNYHVFLASGNGSAAYHSQINVESKQANVVNLINN